MSNHLSFVIRAKNRRLVLNYLMEARTPTEIASRTQVQRSTISRTILELQKEGLVRCITPLEKMGRLYRLTSSGKKIYELLKKR